MPILPLRRITLPLTSSDGFLDKTPVTLSTLRESLEGYLGEEAVASVLRAYRFGEQAHAGQVRRSGEPYISHPLAVAFILADMRLDSRSIIAAILHDVIEDTEFAKDQIAREFGEDVAHLVDGVTKITQIEFESREEAEAENFRKMLLAMSEDIRVILIKLADRLHNMRTMDAMPSNKRQRISSQTLEIYAPIANRLGMHEWCGELEDLSFKHLYPKRYNAIIQAVKRRKGNRRSLLKKLEGLFTEHFEKHGQTVRIVGREKSIYSIYKKMQRKSLSFSEIQDIFAFRIITSSVDECYRCLGLVHQFGKPVPGRFKDYIAIPKNNGYQSLHTSVMSGIGELIEVQIRTEDMHRIAEAGVAAHWMYKSDESSGIEPQQLARQWLLDLLDTQSHAGNPGEFLEHLKTDLFPDQVYVFTPSGDIKKLPSGGTVLDFAYAVHSDIGNRAVAANVNQKRAPLHQELRNGDHIEVSTSKTARPSPSWLNYVTTSKARAAIRASLRTQHHKESINLGRQLLDRALKGLGHKRRLSAAQREGLAKTLALPDWETLLSEIGSGNRQPMVVARQIVPATGDGDEIDESQMAPLTIKGVERMAISYARCCHPIPGDRIMGFFTTGKGLVVHTNDCPNTERLRKHPQSWVTLHWAEKSTGNFQVALRLDTKNKPGVLAALANVIAEADSNIVNVQVDERDGRHSSISFTIEVQNRVHLAHILRQLRADRNLIRVQRKKG